MPDADILNGTHQSLTARSGLRLDGVCSGYGGRDIVQHVTASIARGSFVALVGPNGSGKSTLLSTMARLLKPTEGAVCLDGKSIHNMPTRELARQLGILPQNPSLPEGMRVFDLVSRGRFPHQGLFRQWSDIDEQAVENAMRLTDTLQFCDQPVDLLSGGQKQRCWIAMAIAQDTDIVLLDEPTAFLDMHYQIEILDLLHDLTRNHGRTVVVVLHDLTCAINYADSILFLKDGALAADAIAPAACTKELVSHIFDVDVLEARHPQTNRPLFLPVSRRLGNPS